MPLAGGIHYEVEGAGPPVLLIPGLGGHARSMAPLRERLSNAFTVISHDHRGTGRSIHSNGPYSVAGMADDAFGLLDAVGIERASIVGHSTGGAIALQMALARPARIERVVASAAWARSDAYFRTLFEARLDALLRGGTEDYQRLAALATFPPDWIAEHPDAFASAVPAGAAELSSIDIVSARIAAILAFDILDDLPKISAEVLSIIATDDRVVPPHMSHAAAKRLTHSTMVTLPWGGHAAIALEADAFAEAVRQFLGCGPSAS